MSWVYERSVKILYISYKNTIIDLLNSKYIFMKKLSMSLKILFNVLLFSFYTLFFIIAWNFLFWLFLTLLDRDIPASDDPIHLKLAILVIFLSLLFTLLFRKFFYLRTFSSEVKKTESKIKQETQEELEIYVNKEIK